MIEQKYPVGTKVIYNPPYLLCRDDENYRNKIGFIVNSYRPELPVCGFSDGKLIETDWRSLTPAGIKGEQLLFSFMNG